MGCDSVPKIYGIGKKTAIKVLQKNKIKLKHIGNVDSSLDDVVEEATNFVGACYGVKGAVDMSEVRYKLWRKKTEGGKLTSAPNLPSIPPTKEVFRENVLRAHYQAMLWNDALSMSPPPLDPCEYSWYKDTATKTLLPIIMPSGCNPVPPQVLKIFNCKCSSSKPCSTKSCSCAANNLSCSIFCGCSNDTCHNCWTVRANPEEEEDEENNVDAEDDNLA